MTVGKLLNRQNQKHNVSVEMLKHVLKNQKFEDPNKGKKRKTKPIPESQMEIGDDQSLDSLDCALHVMRQLSDRENGNNK